MLHRAMPLKTMEMILDSKLENCELWSDLKLSEEEFDMLTSRIKQTIPGENRYRGYLGLMSAYPLCAVTQVVYFAVYHFQDEFWTPWAQELDIDFDPAYARSIGAKIISVFAKRGFRYDEDGYKYITPIMCQAGIPYAHLDDLFDAVYAENRMTIDAEAMVRELTEWKSHLLHRSVQRFFKVYPAKAADLLADANDLVQSEMASLCVDEDYDASLVKKFDEWRQHSDERERKRRHQQEYPTPVLSFANDGRGVCLRLPSVTAKNEYISYFRWRIAEEDSDDMREIPCKLFRDANRLYSKEQMVSVRPAQNYVVQLLDDISDRPLMERKVPGFLDASYAVFDGRGRKVTDDYLPALEAYLIARKDVCDVHTAFCNCVDVSLPSGCDGWQGILLAPENQHAVLKVTEGRTSRTLRIRTHIHTELEGEDFLFGQKPCGGNLALYTALPMLHIWLDEGCTIQEMNIRIRHRQTGERVVLEGESVFSGRKTVDFAQYFPHSGFGVYDVRIYEKKYLRKNLTFAYVPDVEHSFHTLRPWPTQFSNAHRTGFEYRLTRGVEIETDDNVGRNIIQRSGCDWVELSLDIPITQIKGRITFDVANGALTLPWVKNVRNFTWSIWKEGEVSLSNCHETQMLTDADLQGGKYWLSTWIDQAYLADEVRIKLLGRGREAKQTVTARLSPQGKFTIALDIFAATLEEAALPVDVVAEFDSDSQRCEVILARISEAVILPNVRCGKDGAGFTVLSWDTDARFSEGAVTIKGITEPDFQQDVELSGLEANENNTRWKKRLSFTMNPGLYKLEQAVEDDFFFDFDDNGYRPPRLQQENILSVSPQSLGAAAQKSVTAFLKFCIFRSGSLGDLQKLDAYICRYHSRMANDISEDTCKLMVCILTNFAEEADDVSKKMVQLVERVSVLFLSGAMRKQFLKWILAYDMSSTQKKLCIRLLDLYLAEHNEAAFLTPADIEKLLHLNPEYGLMWMLRTDQPVGLYSKLCTIVGRDALRTMVVFPDSPDSGWDQSFKDLLGGKGAGAVMGVNKNLMGRSSQFHEMFEWGKSFELPHLNMRKRPESGIYFCGQTYCDLLIYWYLKNRKKGIYDTDYKAMFAPAYQEMDALARQIRGGAHDLASDILHAAKCRQISEGQDGFFPMFYYSAVASLIQTMVYHGLMDPAACRRTKQFLMKMMQIFPELIKRDMLMCELLFYLDGRK